MELKTDDTKIIEFINKFHDVAEEVKKETYSNVKDSVLLNLWLEIDFYTNDVLDFEQAQKLAFLYKEYSNEFDCCITYLRFVELINKLKDIKFA